MQLGLVIQGDNKIKQKVENSICKTKNKCFDLMMDSDWTDTTTTTIQKITVISKNITYNDV